MSPGATSGNGGWLITVPSARVSVIDSSCEKILIVLVRPAAWPSGGDSATAQSAAATLTARARMRRWVRGVIVMPRR